MHHALHGRSVLPTPLPLPGPPSLPAPQVAAATFGFDAPWLPTFTVAEVVTEFLQASACSQAVVLHVAGRGVFLAAHLHCGGGGD